MAKVERLRNSDDILKVLKSNKKCFSNIASMSYLKNNVQSPRMAIVVSKKISNNAVVRNKVKRQIKAIVRESNLVLPSYDFVIIAKPSWLNGDFNSNQKIVRGLLKKAGGSLVNGN